MARVYQTASMGEAHVRLAVVNDMGMADLCVHRVSSWGLAHGAARWFITKDKQDADLWVYFCGVGMAQLKVYFVNNYGEAGWVVENHPLKGRLARLR